MCFTKVSSSDYPQRESIPVPGIQNILVGGCYVSRKKLAKEKYNLELSFLLAVAIEGDRTQKKQYRMSLISIHFAVAKQLEYKREPV